jgi:tetratricopeptide (TPR) repeat protein
MGKTVKSIAEIMEQAERFRQRSMYVEAAALYRRALKNAGDGAERIDCLKSLADTGRMLGRFKESASLYSEAVALSAATGGVLPDAATPGAVSPGSVSLEVGQWRADSLTGLGLSERALGLCDSAMARFNEAGAIYDALHDEAGRAFCRWSMAGALRIKGDIPGAIERYAETEKMFRALGDDLGVGFSLCGLGGASRVKGDYQASLDYYTGANDIFTALDERFGTAYSYCGIGNALRMNAQYKDAARYLKKALKIYEKISDVVSSAYTLWSLGMLEILTKRPAGGIATPRVTGAAPPGVIGGATTCRNGRAASFVNAEKYLDAAQKNFTKTGDVRGTAYVLIARAQIRASTGKTRLAMTLLAKSEEITRQYGFQVEHCHTVFISDALSGKSNNCHEKLGISAPPGAPASALISAPINPPAGASINSSVSALINSPGGGPPYNIPCGPPYNIPCGPPYNIP